MFLVIKNRAKTQTASDVTDDHHEGALMLDRSYHGVDSHVPPHKSREGGKEGPSRLVVECCDAAASLHNIPDILCRVAELTTCNACTKAEITDADGIVFKRIREIIFALGHCADEDADALFRS